MDPISLSVTYFAILLGFGVLIANVLKKRNIPDTFFLLLVGLLFSPTIFSNPVVMEHISIKLVDVNQMGNIPDFLRTLALILVVFTGTFNLNFRVFKKYSSISIKLAFLGVVFNSVVLGFLAHFIFGINLVYAMLLGAVISGTDSSVVFAFEKALAKSKSALSILKVESIFNSPIGVLIPVIVLDLISLTPGALIEPLKYLSGFWLMITVGVGTGLIVGLAIAWILKGILKEYTSLVLFAIALLAYALASGVGGSGMMAVAICGLVAGNFTIGKKEEKQRIIQFQDQFSEMLRISVFTLLGAQVMMLIGLQEFLLIIAFFILVIAVRPIFVIALMGSLRKKMSRKDTLLMSFIAPRGISAAAMIPIIAAVVIAAGQPDVANSMINIVFLVILLSVLSSSLTAGIGSMKRFQQRETKEPQKPEESTPPVETKEDQPDISLMLEKTESNETSPTG